LLGRLTGRDDVVFGVTVAGRPPELAGSERMVGLFINTLPLRLRLRPEESVGGLLVRLQADQARLLEHQHLGLAEIQRLAGLGELFDTLLVFENYPVDPMTAEPAAGVRLALAGNHGGDASHYPLGVLAVPGPRLRLGLSYRPDLFDWATIATLAERLVRLLEAVAADPGQRMGAIDILAPGERKLILEDWNATDHAVPEVTLPALFEAQVAKTPDAIALVFEDQSLSYAELNARANRLAHQLIDLGVGPERLVALALPRSLEMVVGLLAILKCIS